MPGQRGPQADLGGLLVADLADHDDVGVLPQERTEGDGERQADLALDLNLVHSLELVFDGIFNRADVGLRVVQQVQARIQRRALAASRWARHQGQAVGHADRFGKVGRLPFGEAQAGQVKRDRSLVEDSHDHLFAVDRRHRVDAEVNAFVSRFQGDRAVLRNSPLGDVHLGEDLEAGDNHHEVLLRDGGQFMEHAVDAEADLARILEWLQVNIARSGPQRLLEDLVDHPDDPAFFARRRVLVEQQNAFERVVLDFNVFAEII